MKGIGKRAYSDLSCEHNACSKKGFSKKMRWEHDEVPSTLVSGSYNNPFSECRAPTTKVIVDPLIKVRTLFYFNLNFHSNFIIYDRVSTDLSTRRHIWTGASQVTGMCQDRETESLFNTI